MVSLGGLCGSWRYWVVSCLVFLLLSMLFFFSVGNSLLSLSVDLYLAVFSVIIFDFTFTSSISGKHEPIWPYHATDFWSFIFLGSTKYIQKM